jgi:hypothetical protein
MALLLPNVGVAAIGPSNKYFQVLGLISKLKSKVVANYHFMYMGKFHFVYTKGYLLSS